jgi:hypothetical protein
MFLGKLSSKSLITWIRVVLVHKLEQGKILYLTSTLLPTSLSWERLGRRPTLRCRRTFRRRPLLAATWAAAGCPRDRKEGGGGALPRPSTFPLPPFPLWARQGRVHDDGICGSGGRIRSCLRWIYTLRRRICRFGGSAGRDAAATAGRDFWRQVGPGAAVGAGRGFRRRWQARFSAATSLAACVAGHAAGHGCGSRVGCAPAGRANGRAVTARQTVEEVWGRAARWSPPSSPCPSAVPVWRRRSLGLWIRSLAVWSGASVLCVLFASRQCARGWPMTWTLVHPPWWWGWVVLDTFWGVMVALRGVLDHLSGSARRRCCLSARCRSSSARGGLCLCSKFKVTPGGLGDGALGRRSPRWGRHCGVALLVAWTMSSVVCMVPAASLLHASGGNPYDLETTPLAPPTSCPSWRWCWDSSAGDCSFVLRRVLRCGVVCMLVPFFSLCKKIKIKMKGSWCRLEGE